MTSPVTHWFISDIHIGEGTQKQLQDLEVFMRDRVAGEHVHILGDYFSFWMGGVRCPEEARALELLKETSARGVFTSFMRGNRDQLIRFHEIADQGVNFYGDPHRLSLDGKDLVLSHGDLWCTRDTSYMEHRRWVMRPETRAMTFAMTPQQAAAFYLDRIANSPKTPGSDTDPSLLDVNEETVALFCSSWKPDVIMHGHVHAPAIHPARPAEGLRAPRIVLGEWAQSAVVARYQDRRFELLDYLCGGASADPIASISW